LVKTLTFPSKLFKVAPQWSLDGRAERPRSVLDVALLGPTGTIVRAGLVDTGADDTVFPASFAALIGLDLTGHPLALPVGSEASSGL
jgi:hypothetical protein